MSNVAGGSAVINNRDVILQRICSGERLTEIALSLGLADHSAISHRLKHDDEFKSAILYGVEAKIDKRESELEQASDNVTVTRAGKLLDQARWRAKVAAPDIYGDKPLTVNIGVQVSLTAVALGSIEDLLGAVAGVTDRVTVDSESDIQELT